MNCQVNESGEIESFEPRPLPRGVLIDTVTHDPTDRPEVPRVIIPSIESATESLADFNSGQLDAPDLD